MSESLFACARRLVADGRRAAVTLESDDKRVTGVPALPPLLGCSQRSVSRNPRPGKLVTAKRELPFTARRSGVLIRCESVKLLLPGKNLSSLLFPASLPGLKDCLND